MAKTLHHEHFQLSRSSSSWGNRVLWLNSFYLYTHGVLMTNGLLLILFAIVLSSAATMRVNSHIPFNNFAFTCHVLSVYNPKSAAKRMNRSHGHASRDYSLLVSTATPCYCSTVCTQHSSLFIQTFEFIGRHHPPFRSLRE